MAWIACAVGAWPLKSPGHPSDGLDLALQRLDRLLDGEDLAELACR
jgi:hypothetical protein